MDQTLSDGAQRNTIAFDALTVLSGYLEAMRDGDLQPTPVRLQLMDDEVQALRRLVDDLRTLSLADADKLALNRISQGSR